MTLNDLSFVLLICWFRTDTFYKTREKNTKKRNFSNDEKDQKEFTWKPKCLALSLSAAWLDFTRELS